MTLLGCTVRPAEHPNAARFANGDAALLQGCYDCLIEARAEYRRWTAGRTHTEAITRTFEADLLIALREKELGIPPSDALQEARGIAAELPREFEASRYLALVDAVPPEQLGLPRRDAQAFVAAHAPVAARIRTELRWLTESRLRQPIRDYLRIALTCAYPDGDDANVATVPDGESTRPQPSPAFAARATNSPLLAYRDEICDLTHTSSLAAVRTREPRFIETSFFLANTEIAAFASTAAGQIKAHLAEVVARFPTSPAVTYLAASYARLVDDCPQALPFYDRTLATQPNHEQALLGRMICLTNLQRPQEAIVAATRLIDLAPDNVAEAYYWRAWNRHVLVQINEARADIATAKNLLAEPYVLSLAGILAYAQRDLDAAQGDLEAALAGAPADCVARSYLALVQQARKQWLIAGQVFEDAMTCYHARADDGTARIHSLQTQANADPVYRARELARLQSAVESDIRQARRSALAGAKCHANGKDARAARRLLDVASEDPTFADDVDKLRKRLSTADHLP